jgi:hypothetical protein
MAGSLIPFVLIFVSRRHNSLLAGLAPLAVVLNIVYHDWGLSPEA